LRNLLIFVWLFAGSEEDRGRVEKLAEALAQIDNPTASQKRHWRLKEIVDNS
jgi:hypothetical protein